MIKVIFLVLALLFATQIIRRRGVNKLTWFMAGILFFPHSIKLVESPLITFPRFIVIVMVLCYIFQERRPWKRFKSFPLNKTLMCVFALMLCIGLFDQRLSLPIRIFRPVTYYIENFVILYLTYYYLNSINDLRKILKSLCSFFIVFCIYGVFNYVIKSSPYHVLIYGAYGGVDFGSMNMTAGIDRFRISSFAWHAIYYGLLLAVEVLLLAFSLNSSIFPKKRHFYLISVLGIVILNLLLTNSRTPLIALIVGLGIFYLYSISFVTKIKIGVAVILVGFVVISFVPKAFRIIDATVDTFTSGGAGLDENSSSSLEMREAQLAASFLLFSQNPWFGNGFFYITEDLGYSSDKDKRTSDKDLYGFESYGYKLLIEQGLVGILANILFFGALYVFFIKQYKAIKNYGKKLAIISISITTTFLLFIFGTGDMNSFLVVVSILGICMKGCVLFKNSNIISVKNIQLQ